MMVLTIHHRAVWSHRCSKKTIERGFPATSARELRHAYRLWSEGDNAFESRRMPGQFVKGKQDYGGIFQGEANSIQ